MLMSEVMTAESPLLWKAFKIKTSLHRTQLKTYRKRIYISFSLSFGRLLEGNEWNLEVYSGIPALSFSSKDQLEKANGSFFGLNHCYLFTGPK